MEIPSDAQSESSSTSSEEQMQKEYRKQLMLKKLRMMVPHPIGTNERHLKAFMGSDKMPEHQKYPHQPGMKSMHNQKHIDRIASCVFTSIPHSYPTVLDPIIINVCSKWLTGVININSRALSMLVDGYTGMQNEINFPAIRIAKCMNQPLYGAMDIRIFLRGGKATCTGAKTITSARTAAHEVVKYLQTMGIAEARVIKFTITNIVSKLNCGFHINVVEMVRVYKDKVSYKPKKFPALFYYDNKESGSAVFVIFPCGQIIVAGVDNETELSRLNELAFQKAMEFRTTKPIVDSAILEYKARNDSAAKADLDQKTDNVAVVYNAGSVTAMLNDVREISRQTMQEVIMAAKNYAQNNQLSWTTQAPVLALDDNGEEEGQGDLEDNGGHADYNVHELSDSESEPESELSSSGNSSEYDEDDVYENANMSQENTSHPIASWDMEDWISSPES